MAKGTNASGIGSTTNINGLKLYPKINTNTTSGQAGLGSKISNAFSQLRSNPSLLTQLGTGILGFGLSIPTGQENKALGHNQITASYYRNPYLQQALGQKVDMGDYYADFMNNLYLSNIAKEAEKAKQRKLIDNDTETWYNNYVQQTQNAPLPVISGGSGINGLDAMEGTIA